MADSKPPSPSVELGGCGFAIGVVFLLVLAIVALFSTHLASVLTRPDDAKFFAVISAVLWVVWLGIAVLMFRASQKAN